MDDEMKRKEQQQITKFQCHLFRFKNVFSDLKKVFKTESLVHQLDVDLHRLDVLFFFDFVCNKHEIYKVTALLTFVEYIQELEDFYSIRLYFLALFCNQNIFFFPCNFFNSLYANHRENVYLLDSDDSLKMIKIHFSKHSIFVIVLGSFVQAHISHTDFKKVLVFKIHFSMNFAFEVKEKRLVVPRNINLKWHLEYCT